MAAGRSIRGQLAAAVGVALAVLATMPAPALAWTATELREACSDGDLYYLYGACAGYLVAVADALPDGRACLPMEGTVLVIEDAMDAVAAVPEVAEETGPALAERVLAETYPC